MEKNVYLYRLDFSPDASTSERGEMCTLLESVGAMVSPTFESQRSGPFGLEYSRRIVCAQVTVMSDWEKDSIHYVIDKHPVFAKSTLTKIR